MYSQFRQGLFKEFGTLSNTLKTDFWWLCRKSVLSICIAKLRKYRTPAMPGTYSNYQSKLIFGFSFWQSRLTFSGMVPKK